MNIFGLYRLKDGYSRESLPNFHSDSRLDDQTSGWWIVCLDKTSSPYYVDTYHIYRTMRMSNKPDFTVESKLLSEAHIGQRITDSSKIGYANIFLENHLIDLILKKDNTFLIRSANSEFYYQGSIKSSEQVDSYFEEICDLREFTFTTQDSVYKYNSKDLVEYVQLHFEQFFNWHGKSGGFLVKLDAKPLSCKSDLNLLQSILAQNYTYTISSNDIKRLEEIVERDGDKGSQEVLEFATLYNSYMSELSKLKSTAGMALEERKEVVKKLEE